MNTVLMWLDGKKTYLGAAIVALAVFVQLLGGVSAEAAQMIQAFGASVMAVGLRHALGKVTGTDSTDNEDGPGAPTAYRFRRAVAITLAVLLLSAPAWAQCPCGPGCPCPPAACPQCCAPGVAKPSGLVPVQPASVYVLPWRERHYQDLKKLQSDNQSLQNQLNDLARRPQGDPALVAAIQQLAMQNQQIIALLMSQQGQPAPAPTPAPAPAPAPQGPQLFFLQPPQSPLQQIPLGGQPLQQIPLGGAPQQNVPLGGQPLQQLIIGAPPQQQMPLGGAPLQQIPLGPTAPPAPPGSVKPAAPAPQAMPPATGTVGPPTSYQRFTPSSAGTLKAK